MGKTKSEKAAHRLWDSLEKPIPVNLKKIVKALKIKLIEQPLDEDVSGMLVTAPDGSVVIVVNSDHHEHRKRFTIAHEIGHFILHRDLSPVFVDGSKTFLRNSLSSKGSDIHEIEANTFAAELLMPEEYIRTQESSPVSLMQADRLESIAKHLNVSQMAVCYRFVKLGLLEPNSI